MTRSTVFLKACTRINNRISLHGTRVLGFPQLLIARTTPHRTHSIHSTHAHSTAQHAHTHARAQTQAHTQRMLTKYFHLGAIYRSTIMDIGDLQARRARLSTFCCHPRTCTRLHLRISGTQPHRRNASMMNRPPPAMPSQSRGYKLQTLNDVLIAILKNSRSQIENGRKIAGAHPDQGGHSPASRVSRPHDISFNLHVATMR